MRCTFYNITGLFNYIFSSKRIRVNLNVPVKSETKQEAETTLTAVESDRKLSIQVRIGLIVSLTFLHQIWPRALQIPRLMWAAVFVFQPEFKRLRIPLWHDRHDYNCVNKAESLAGVFLD